METQQTIATGTNEQLQEEKYPIKELSSDVTDSKNEEDTIMVMETPTKMKTDIKTKILNKPAAMDARNEDTESVPTTMKKHNSAMQKYLMNLKAGKEEGKPEDNQKKYRTRASIIHRESTLQKANEKEILKTKNAMKNATNGSKKGVATTGTAEVTVDTLMSNNEEMSVQIEEIDKSLHNNTVATETKEKKKIQKEKKKDDKRSQQLEISTTHKETTIQTGNEKKALKEKNEKKTAPNAPIKEVEPTKSTEALMDTSMSNNDEMSVQHNETDTTLNKKVDKTAKETKETKKITTEKKQDDKKGNHTDKVEASESCKWKIESAWTCTITPSQRNEKLNVRKIAGGILEAMHHMDKKIALKIFGNDQPEGKDITSSKDMPQTEKDINRYIEDPRMTGGNRLTFRLHLRSEQPVTSVISQQSFRRWMKSQKILMYQSKLKTTKPMYVGFIPEAHPEYKKIEFLEQRVAIILDDKALNFQITVAPIFVDGKSNSTSIYMILADKTDALKIRSKFEDYDHIIPDFIPWDQYEDLPREKKLNIILTQQNLNLHQRSRVVSGFTNEDVIILQEKRSLVIYTEQDPPHYNMDDSMTTQQIFEEDDDDTPDEETQK
jgi:hypothetical protein